MSLPIFFNKATLAASQVLHGFVEEDFRTYVEACTIGVVFDDAAAASAEGQTTLSLLVNLLSRLYSRIVIIPLGPKAQVFSEQIRAIAEAINPRIEIPSAPENIQFCVVVGNSASTLSCPKIFIGSDGWILTVSSKNPVGSGSSLNPFGASAAACFGAANAFRFLFGKQLKNGALDDDLRVSLLDWDRSNLMPPNPMFEDIAIGETHLVGVGAIGNAALWTLARVLKAKGVLHLIDKESVELSNLQRYVLANDRHKNIEKVRLGVEALHGSAIQLISHHQTWGEYLAARDNWNLDRVMVAVDSANVRRNIQGSLPRWVANAWTQPGDIGVSRHSFHDNEACLMCLYFPPGLTKNEDQLIAETIGLPESLMEVRVMLYRNTPLDRTFLNRIAAARGIGIESLLAFENRPLRSFYVEGVCGGAIIELAKGPTLREMEVPMNFQSALAGVMLATELVADAGTLRSERVPTTTKIDLLKPLGIYLSLPEPKHISGKCICQDQDYISIFKRKHPQT